MHDEPCANTCENYNVPCNVTPPAGIFYGPHCVCKEGFSRLPNGKCVDIDDTKCKELWNPILNPTSTPIPTTTTRGTTPIPTTTTIRTTPKPCHSLSFITLYDNRDFNGVSKNMQMKQGECYDLIDFNDRVTSVDGHDCVILYEACGCTGQQLQISEYERCRKSIDECSIPFGNKASSIRLCPRDECQVTTPTPPSTTCFHFSHSSPQFFNCQNDKCTLKESI